MTQEQIFEGNKLIAEFMGGKVAIFNVSNQPYFKNLLHGRTILFADLKYHTSWDWIMPVVEKIEKLTITSNWDYDHVYLKQYPSGLNREKYYARFVSETSPNNWYLADVAGKTKIEAAWLAVVEFINWYNCIIKNK